jgi:hypothetical protein
MKASKKIALVSLGVAVAVSAVVVMNTFTLHENGKYEMDHEATERPAEETANYIIERIERTPTAPVEDFTEIDQHARACSPKHAKSTSSLANYLQKPCTNDVQKARAIYVWLCHFINYDDEGYNKDLDRDYSAEAVLKSRTAVCEGFSNLYLALGKEMQLKIEKVIGYAKGYSYEEGQKFKETNHAWNIVFLNNQWRICDATWGEGFGSNVNGKLKSTKRFKEYWFNCSPYEAIFTHFPAQQKQAIAKPDISLALFEAYPKLDNNYFGFGFNGTATYRALYSNHALKFPTCYLPDSPVEARVAPKYRYLQHNTGYQFTFYIPKGKSLVVIDAKGNWTYFKEKDKLFTLNYKAIECGDLTLTLQEAGSNSKYYTMLVYEVIDSALPH